MRDKILLILATSWKPNRIEFLSALGVSSGGLGEQLFGNVYEALFCTSIDVKDEFRKYYAIEYSSLAEYVEIRYGEALNEADLEAEYVFLVTWLPQVVDTDYDENKLETILELISKLEEVQNEDKT